MPNGLNLIAFKHFESAFELPFALFINYLEILSLYAMNPAGQATPGLCILHVKILLICKGFTTISLKVGL